MNEQLQLKLNEAYYFLCLSGGLGGRICQSVFVRELIRKRKEENNHTAPIIVIDSSILGQQIAEALKDQNVFSLQVAESPTTWPHNPGLMTYNGAIEHPLWIPQWYENYKSNSLSVYDIINKNWKRSYSIEYGFSLTKMINLSKHKDEKESFICYHYGKVMGLPYTGGIPMLKMTQFNKELNVFINNLSKPFVLIHLGVDLNPNDLVNSINYRFFKIWSLQHWVELAEKLKDKYEFVQIYANEINPELPGIKSIKVNNLNPVLQLLSSSKCKLFVSIDNFLPHLASSIKKPGVVLWSNVSPFVWSWNLKYHSVPHFPVYNRHSCPEIFCWRPNVFDSSSGPQGKNWICQNSYNCMKSITVKQVLNKIEEVEEWISKNKDKNLLTL